jgi:hypothetical protein
MRDRTGRVAGWSAGIILLVAFVLATAGGQLLRGQLTKKSIPSLSHWFQKRWVNKDGVAAKYETTSEASDLDREVRLGAKILKYRDGTYPRTIHKQYPQVCGPASLAIVLKQLGITDPPRSPNPGTIAAPRRHVFMPRSVDRNGSETVDVGYSGSMEHIMWLGYHRRRLEAGNRRWNDGKTNSFMSADGVLVTTPQLAKLRFDKGRLDYYSGDSIPSWMWDGPAVGYAHGKDYSTGLPGIMNYIFSGGRNGPWRDAMPLSFDARADAAVVAYRRVIKGFIDNGISVVCVVEGGGHFNALIGYRGSVSPATAPFYIYTADPLDGWGRSNPDNQPLTWRRILVVRANMLAGNMLLRSIICWNHHAAGGAEKEFRRGDWAGLVDRENGRPWLLGGDRQPQEKDPLNDPLARPVERRQ